MAETLPARSMCVDHTRPSLRLGPLPARCGPRPEARPTLCLVDVFDAFKSSIVEVFDAFKSSYQTKTVPGFWHQTKTVPGFWGGFWPKPSRRGPCAWITRVHHFGSAPSRRGPCAWITRVHHFCTFRGSAHVGGDRCHRLCTFSLLLL